MRSCNIKDPTTIFLPEFDWKIGKTVFKRLNFKGIDFRDGLMPENSSATST